MHREFAVPSAVGNSCSGAVPCAGTVDMVHEAPKLVDRATRTSRSSLLPPSAAGVGSCEKTTDRFAALVGSGTIQGCPLPMVHALEVASVRGHGPTFATPPVFGQVPLAICCAVQGHCCTFQVRLAGNV